MNINNNEELHLLINAAYSDLNQGLEQLRMFDKFMCEIEVIAEVAYDENGNVRFHEADAFGRVLKEDDGSPITLTRLKDGIVHDLPLNDCKGWLRARLQNAWWPAKHTRCVLRLLERIDSE